MNRTHTDLRVRVLIILAISLALLGETSPSLARPMAVAAPIILSVDAAADNAPISPDIYGMNRADAALLAELPITVNRWGGTSASRYNYLTNISNHGIDWYFENTPEETPANTFIETNGVYGAETVLTVPTSGHVSNGDPDACGASISTYGVQGTQTGKDPSKPDCGSGTLTSGAYLANMNPADTSEPAPPEFVTGWVSALASQFGESAPKYYALDNEPDQWNDTHHDIHPDPMGYDDLLDMATTYGAAVKAGNPDALVLGPVSHGWYAYFFSAEDWTSSTGTPWQFSPPDRALHENKEFIAWYLEEMQDYADEHSGTRLLDYLDLHFYTQVPGVALSSAGNKATKARRLRSTRSLWDPTYIESADASWIDQPVRLIPRMHTWVDTNYPGTKLAITEYNWGGLENINGALAQADVLGIFGRERVDLAALEAPPGPDQPGAYAFRMYLDYDGAGGHFGDTTIQASSARQDQLAIYGSRDSGSGELKLMVINKTSKPLTGSISLTTFSPSSCVYTHTYSPANLGAIMGGWYPIDGGEFSYSFSGQSITLLVIPPETTPCSIPVSAAAAPAGSSPKDGAIFTASATKISWKKLKGAVYYYELEVEDGSGSPVFSGPVNATTYSLSLAYGRYQWRVRGALADGLTGFSPWRTFDVTRLSSPKNRSSVRMSKVVFKWKSVKNATYHLTAWKDKGLPTESVEINQPVTGTSFKPVTPLPVGNYTWTLSVNGTAMPEWDVTVVP